MGCFASTPETPRYVTPTRVVQAGRAMPQPGTYSNYYAQAEAAFRAGDVNGDGVLDAQELYMVLVRLGFFNGVPPQYVHEMMEEQMARADSSVRDRKVTFDEFVPYFEYLMHQLAQRGIMQQPAAPTQFYGQPQYGVPALQYGEPGGGASGAKYRAPSGAQFGAPQNHGRYGARSGGKVGKAGGVGAGGVAAAVVGGAVVGSVLTDGGEGIAGAVGSAGGAIASGAGAVADWAPGAMSSAGGALYSAGDAIGGFAGDAIGEVGSFAGDAISAISDFF